MSQNKFMKISKEQFIKDFSGYVDIASMNTTYNELQIPKRATKHSACYDFYAPFDITIHPGYTFKFPTGIKVELKSDCVLMIAPRSSLGMKYKLKLDNTIGIIDSDYFGNESNEGHMWVSFTNMSADSICVIPKGTAMCQGMILHYDVTVDDNENELNERTGGMGSTDK